MKKKIIALIFLSMSLWGIKAQKISSNIVIKDINGNSITFGEARNKKPIILSFWSTSCRPCIAELTAMAKIEARWKDKIKVIVVSIDDSRSSRKIKSIVRARNWSYNVYVDETLSLYKALNLYSIPASFVIDSYGNIRYSHTGYKAGDEIILVEQALKYANQIYENKK